MARKTGYSADSSKSNKLMILVVQFTIILLLLAFAFTIVRFYLFQPVPISGSSMLPTFYTDDVAYVATSGYKLEYKDVICFYRPSDFSNFDEEDNPALSKHSGMNLLYSIPFLGREIYANEEQNTSNWKLLIKRVMGLPNDTIELKAEMQDGDHRIFLYRNGTKVEDDCIMYDSNYYEGEFGKSVQNNVYPVPLTTLGDDEYYVMGDNRGNSVDSKVFGPIKADWIYGKLVASTRANKFGFGTPEI